MGIRLRDRPAVLASSPLLKGFGRFVLPSVPSVGRGIRLRDRPPVLASSPLLKSIGFCTVSVTAGHEFG